MSDNSLSLRFRLLAVAGVLTFVALMILYVREFGVFSNTIGASRLVAGSIIVALLGAGVVLYRFWDRFSPWERHLPEFFSIIIFSAAFAPLFGSLINRGLGKTTYESFEFLSETPYVATGYGLLMTGKITMYGYYLEARQQGALYRFRYKKQAYYPLTKPGDPIMLPIREGLFGVRVMELK